MEAVTRMKVWAATRLRALAQRLDPQRVTVTNSPNGGSLIKFRDMPVAEISHGMINDMRPVRKP
jgi:hypothetical protein